MNLSTAAAVLLAAVVLLPPFGTLAHATLFSAHMLQHLILLLAVPGLAMLGRADPCAPAGGEAQAPGARVAVGWAAGAAGMWVWHIPALCDAAATRASVACVQDASLLVLGALFWRPLLDRRPSERLSPGGAVGYLFTSCLACTLQGVILTFSPVEVCSAYLTPADRLHVLPWLRQHAGYSPQSDQQIGGLIMWVPACLVYLGAILGQLGRWYGAAAPAAIPPPNL